MLRRLRLASHAPSLGGVETLVSEPRFTSHALLTPEDRTEQGITDGFIRVSLGIEDVEDIIADFDAALGSP
jgi:cystathionine gamma-synthase